jgi:hypothetical protein
MQAMKVREYGLWTSYTYTKENDETLAIALIGVGRGLREQMIGMI